MAPAPSKLALAASKLNPIHPFGPPDSGDTARVMLILLINTNISPQDTAQTITAINYCIERPGLPKGGPWGVADHRRVAIGKDRETVFADVPFKNADVLARELKKIRGVHRVVDPRQKVADKEEEKDFKKWRVDESLIVLLAAFDRELTRRSQVSSRGKRLQHRG